MRVGIDVDFGNKNLTRSQDGHDLRADHAPLDGTIPRVVALLDEVYADTRAALLAHDRTSEVGE